MIGGSLVIVFPAIDLRDGNCVRLLRGDFSKETIYLPRPEEAAHRWESEGAEILHIVDLDGALAGEPCNLDAVKKILQTVNIPIELGGGIRTLNTIEKILELGVYRVVLGSAAIHRKELVKEACNRYNEHIIVGIDAKDGMAAIEGWGTSGNVTAIDLSKELVSLGVKTIIYTDISRDGTLSGVNVESTVKLASEAGIHIVASGGVKSLDDIRSLKLQEKNGIQGVIVGKAIYEGTLSLRAAIMAAR